MFDEREGLSTKIILKIWFVFLVESLFVLIILLNKRLGPKLFFPDVFRSLKLSLN